MNLNLDVVESESGEEGLDLGITLDDKYTEDGGRLYMTGVQALTRIPMIQAKRDKKAGLNTKGFISGYRGSPLGGYDQALWQAKDFLEKQDIKFQPAVNEELAATAVLGTQQVNNYPSANVDGVFAIWYGKGPGLDRASDAMKHANLLGTSARGGVLVVVGDDHGAVSSATAHQCEYLMSSWMMPVLHPASVQEYLDYGVLGIAMSRFSGCYVGFKAVSETVETAATVDASIDRPKVVIPEFDMPPGGLHARWPDPQLMQEDRLVNHRIPAVKAFARANGIDQEMWPTDGASIGIVSTGKSYTDLRQALDDLGIDEAEAAKLDIKLYKVGMPWPLEDQGALAFAKGLSTVLVVEEKRPMIEDQLKEVLYDLPDGQRPRIIGKKDASGQALLPSSGELSPAMIAEALAKVLPGLDKRDGTTSYLEFLAAKRKQMASQPIAIRPPYFCSGCPHNTSTRVPEGSRALAGTGCHLMAAFTNPQTSSLIQMGGEGANWIGQAPYVDEDHMFQNLGDGTYTHSGSLAIRQAVAAKSTITFKILYNDAVAMTGGQATEGGLSAANIAQQVFHEGVGRIAVVYNDPERLPDRSKFPASASFHHRDELDDLQKEMRKEKGVSVIIYNQTCAAEKRRRRRRGNYPDPIKRVYINQRVCDGCGDCSRKSNCISVIPEETPWGRKRRIDQSSCNKDFTCVNGFCPAFVTLEGAEVRRKSGVAQGPSVDIPEPVLPSLDKPYGVLIAGVGGTGVVTIGQIMGVAALIEGKGASVLDFTGLAQKGGGVLTHLRLAKSPDEIRSPRLPMGGADLLLAGDMVVASGNEAISKLRQGHSKAVVNSMVLPTAATVLQPDFAVDERPLRRVIEQSVGEGNATFLDATKIAETLIGDAITANIFLLGYAYQLGAVPLKRDSLMRAVELNRVNVEANRRCFDWGRMAAYDPAALLKVVDRLDVAKPFEETLDELLVRLETDLVRYQDRAYADRFKRLVGRVRAQSGTDALTEAVARSLHRLMAHKDEYEVASHYTDSDFMAELREKFSGDFRVHFHMAPDMMMNRDAKTGELKKRRYGPWMATLLKILSKFKGLRGTMIDPFSWLEERRTARRLIEDYENTIEELLAKTTEDNLDLAMEIARIPMEIRGYGHIKAATVAAADKKGADLMQRFRTNKPEALAAE